MRSQKILFLTAVTISALAGTRLHAQARPSPLTFEVASVKPHNGADPHRALPQFLPGRFTAAGFPLRRPMRL